MAHPAIETMLKAQVATAGAGRVERYFARVDAEIAGKDFDASLAFLRKELATWDRRYQVWQRAVDRGDEIGSGASAFDYATTIATLAARIGRLERNLVAA
jgi:hypothetical protein